MSDVDFDALDSYPSFDVFRERYVHVLVVYYYIPLYIHFHPSLVCFVLKLILIDHIRSTLSFDRTLLMREILIFLNRVVSHPQFSIPVLQALTSSRHVASLSVNIANRLSKKRKCFYQDDTITKQIRELEITDLARVFKRRVFAFMGDSIS